MSRKCPCKECICVPMCRYKSFNKLMENCCLLKNLIFHEFPTIHDTKLIQGHSRMIRKAEKILKPIKWRIKKDGWQLEEVKVSM